ncbi:MAG: T9SS type A sorting domain-containing protein [Bacteroidales bacterium]|jgi:hypothetical protein|nr:T9SS type A sorting domain-containing protein [Bacteroidales bacterium]
MKKVVLLLSVFMFGFCALNHAQIILPDGNFESWSLYTPVPPSSPFYEPTGGFFKTLNILDTIPTPPGITAYRCDTAHTGSYSVRCITRKIDLLSILIPGVVGNIRIKWTNNSAVLGSPFNWATKPLRFQGYYKSYPLNGDSTGAILLLSKWNASSLKRDTIAYNKLVFHGIIPEWTKFDTAIIYRTTTVMPDSITILLLSCAGYNATVMYGSVGQIGSQALFDDVTITGVPPYAVENLMNQSMRLTINPNPASDYIYVNLERTVKDGRLEIYDTQGRLISKFQMPDVTGRFSISSLSAGMYYYRFSDSDHTLTSGSFIINRQ